jgi:lysophospholipase L1-like esterase
MNKIEQELSEADLTEAEVTAAREDKASLDARLDGIDSQLAEKAKQTDHNALQNQVNNLVMVSGDVTNNSSLLDIKTGADGIVRNTPGEAVRNTLKRIFDFPTNFWTGGNVSIPYSVGNVWKTFILTINNFVVGNTYALNIGQCTGYTANFICEIDFYNSSDVRLSYFFVYNPSDIGTDKYFTIPANTAYAKVLMTAVAGTAAATSGTCNFSEIYIYDKNNVSASIKSKVPMPYVDAQFDKFNGLMSGIDGVVYSKADTAINKQLKKIVEFPINYFTNGKQSVPYAAGNTWKDNKYTLNNLEANKSYVLCIGECTGYIVPYICEILIFDSNNTRLSQFVYYPSDIGTEKMFTMPPTATYATIDFVAVTGVAATASGTAEFSGIYIYESTNKAAKLVIPITEFKVNFYIFQTITAVVGKELNLYFDNFIECDRPNDIYIKASSGTLTYSMGLIQLDEGIRLTPTVGAIGTHSITVGVYKLDGTLIYSKVITIKIVANTALSTTKKVLFIGDSLTYNGTMIDTIKNDVGNNITFYGTQTDTNGLKHEGRYGWKAYDYLFTQSSGGFTNPFYNSSLGTTSKFDFSYYMTNNPTFADVEIVNIFLGRNDGYGDNTNFQQYISTMIDSIHAYNPNIIVTVMCPYLTAKSNDGCGKYLQSTNENKLAAFKGLNVLYTALGNKENLKIYIVPQYINLDTSNDFPTQTVAVSARNTKIIARVSDNVHPDIPGYKKFADVWYNWLINYISS